MNELVNAESVAGPAAPRILIVRVGAMGDVLHGMPAVAALRAALPDAVIGWAIEPRWASLLQASGDSLPGTPSMPLVDHVHPVPTKVWSESPLSAATMRSVLELRRALRAGQYDITIDLQGSMRSSLIARASGASRVIGSTAPREGPARLLYTERVSPTALHVVEQAAEIASGAIHGHLVASPAPLPVDADAEQWCDTLIARNSEARHASEAGRLIFLAPTAGWGAKQWPAHRYGELAAELAARGFRVLVNASPHGVDPVMEEVVQASAGKAEPVACTLSQLTALLRRVRLAIAGDSGPLHLAAALDVPVVAIFGPTDPARNGPFGTKATVLRHALSQTDHRRHAVPEAGLEKLGTAEVLAAALRMLRGMHPTATHLHG